MDFEYTLEQDTSRKQFRGWLAANLPAELRVVDPVDDRVASTREIFERRVAWQKSMHKAGWVGIAWPREYGGRNPPPLHRGGAAEGTSRAPPAGLPAMVRDPPGRRS